MYCTVFKYSTSNETFNHTHTLYANLKSLSWVIFIKDLKNPALIAIYIFYISKKQHATLLLKLDIIWFNFIVPGMKRILIFRPNI